MIFFLNFEKPIKANRTDNFNLNYLNTVCVRVTAVCAHLSNVLATDMRLDVFCVYVRLKKIF